MALTLRMRTDGHVPPLYQVRNEISVLKRVSKGHTNIVTLHDYFEVCIICFHFIPSIPLNTLFLITFRPSHP